MQGLLNGLAKLPVTLKAYKSQDNIVELLQCYKLVLKTNEISRQTGVKPVTVRRAASVSNLSPAES